MAEIAQTNFGLITYQVHLDGEELPERAPYGYSYIMAENGDFIHARRDDNIEV